MEQPPTGKCHEAEKPAWTNEDEERFRAFVAQGGSIIRAAAAFWRPIVSIRNHARKIGCPFPPLRAVRQKWKDSPDNFRANYRTETHPMENGRAVGYDVGLADRPQGNHAGA